LIPAIMSGGSGTRLWPLSTEVKPKQFHALGSDLTLIQHAALRVAGIAGLEAGAPIVICNRRHLSTVQAQMAAIDCTPTAIVLEPFGRNTAPVAAIAALLAEAEDPEALVLLMPADHIIGDAEGFAATIASAAPSAQTHIVVFGVNPTAAETGYGYIEAGELLTGPVRRVDRFAEKPDLATAERYLAGGRHLWNAGIFLFSPRVLLAEMQRLAPDVVPCARRTLARSPAKHAVIDLDGEAFGACPSISLDHAVMEGTEQAAVAPLGIGWADIGSWSELWRLGPRDEAENFLRGDVALIDTQDCMIWSEGKTVGAIGLRDLIVVQTEDAVIVLPKSRAQDVKLLVEQLKARAPKPA
jgi:mannose-1-phosphate guanylyltransferase/mannose-6-phosphate isomerase